MHVWIIVLISIVSFLVVALVTALITAEIVSSRDKDVFYRPRPCDEVININSLLQLESKQDCEVNGATGTYYYIGNDTDFDFVVSKLMISPQDICIQYCTSFGNSGCSGPEYKGASAEESYIFCSYQTSQGGCIPPIPMAAKGTTLFYAYSPTSKMCTNIP